MVGEPFEIYIVGLGIMGVRHMTREAEDCIRASRKVFAVDHGFGMHKYLESLCPNVVNLLDRYQEGKSRLITYREMALAVIDEALENGPVTFATYGHPTMFVYPSLLIRRAALLLQLKTHVVPGISIFDTALVDLDLDPGMTGIQIFEATAVIIDRRHLDPGVPCLLLQIDAIESGLFTRAPSRPERFFRLRDHLMKYYTPDHQVVTLLSPTFPLLEPVRQQFPLRELAERCAQTTLGGTLYIPPLPSPRSRDEELASLLMSSEHLNKITRSA